MTWTIQRDASGNIVGAGTAAGAHAGPGDAVVLADPATGLEGIDPLLPAGEVYYTPNDSVLPLANDVLILASRDASGAWSIEHVAHGGHCVATLMGLLGASRVIIGQLQAAAGSQMGLDAALQIVTDAIKKGAGVS